MKIDKKIIIDCDTGCDDAIGLIQASLLHLDVIGVTCVAGNTTIEHASQNTVDVLNYIHQNTPVYVGCDKPLEGKLLCDGYHGENGLGEIELPHYSFIKKDAVEFMYQACMENEISLLCTGPLTNIATLLIKHPDVASHIREIFIMGGSLRGGNVTPYAEFNVYIDPKAYEIVLKAGIPCTMVGLDVTMVPYFTLEMMEELKKIPGEHSMLSQIILSYLYRRGLEDPDQKLHIHDMIALYALVYPEIFTYKELHLDVEPAESERRGMMHVDVDDKANCRYAMSVDCNQLWKHFFENLKGE